MSAPGPWLIPLPASPAALAETTWEDIAGWYRLLAQHPLDRATVTDWLRTWSRLEELLTEAASLAMIAYTCDTADPAKRDAHLRFSAEIMPRVQEQGVALARRLVASHLVPPGMETPIRRFRAAIEVFREANVPLMTELEELGSDYQRLTGGMTAEWEGRRIALPLLAPHLQSPDRHVRERAWRCGVAPYVVARSDLAALFDRMLERRQRVARNAGFPSFREYVFPARFRFDYTPDDCLRFHDAVEEAVVPAVGRVMAERRRRLGLDPLRPWDLGVNPYRPEPLRPYRDPCELPGVARRVFGRVDETLGAWFQILLDEKLLDLDAREGKAPGGYCDTLHARGRPFIFMNASGVMDDVRTLVHEAGHAFHSFASHRQPLIWQRYPTAESAELASMSMELLAAPHLARPDGYLEEVDARRARLEHLEDVLASLAHIASVDAFQHWIYTSRDGGEAGARDAAWLRLRERFDPGVDWTGLEQERAARWYRQLHIFLYPFYYIEYGLAQLGALQVWRNARTDPAGAVAAYRRFLALGATRPLPDLYGAAGARLVFDRPAVLELVQLVEAEVGALRAGLPGDGEVAPA
jgi:oligoendopeptidase F